MNLLCRALLTGMLLGVSLLNSTGYSAEQTAAIESPRELFDLFGIDAETTQDLINGRSLGADEHELLARLLMRLPQIKLRDIERWTRRGVDWQKLTSEPSAFQREFVHLSGRVVHVTRETPAPEHQARYAIEHYFRCEMLLKNDRAVVVYANHVPEAWKRQAEIDERASANAVFLKTGELSESDEPVLYLAADRVAWHPDTLLGNAGMDCGLFDTIEQMRPITSADRECFFQLLAAAGRVGSETMTQSAPDSPAELVPLLKSPQEHTGGRHTFRGVARRAVRIQITDADTVARLGFDHYFELVIFVSIDAVVGGERVRSHPVVYCVRTLPAGFPTGEGIAEMATVTGFMFKKWPYTTQATAAKDPDLRMSSPLLVGQSPIWAPRAPAERSSISLLAAGASVIVIAVVAGVVWWLGIRERRLQKEAAANSRSLPERVSLGDLDLD